MEGYLNLRIQPWLRRLITRLLAIVPAFLTILYFGEEKLGALLVLSQVVLSMQLGFAVIPLIHFVSEKEKMGDFAIKPWVKICAWVTALIIVVLNVKLVVESIADWISTSANPLPIYFIVIPLAVVVAILLLYITFAPFFRDIILRSAKIPHAESTELVRFAGGERSAGAGWKAGGIYFIARGGNRRCADDARGY